MNAFSLSVMQVGVFDSAAYVNNAKAKMLTFPNYSDPAFPKKWKNKGDSVAFSVEELPSEGKEHDIRVSLVQFTRRDDRHGCMTFQK